MTLILQESMYKGVSEDDRIPRLSFLFQESSCKLQYLLIVRVFHRVIWNQMLQ